MLVARREWNERVGARSYRITTVVLVAAVVLAVGIPALLSGSSKPHKIGVVGGARGVGIGATALVQVAALVAALFIVAAATGSNVLHGAAVGVVVIGAIWMVVG